MRHNVLLCSPRVADERLAAALKRSLERYAAPPFGAGPIRVTVSAAQGSEADGPAGAPVAALAGAEALVLIASPYAAHSAAALRQCAWWAESKDTSRLFVLRADGDLAWRDRPEGGGDFDWERTSALPSSLRGAFRQMPLTLDVSWARQLGELSDRDPRFLDVVARLAAAIRGMSLDAVAGEAARRQTQSRQAAAIGAAALLGVAVIGAGWGWNATQHRAAAEQARTAAAERQAQADAARIAAERQRTEIDAQRRLADDRRTDAERQRAEMERQRAEAEVQTKLADARRVESEKLRADAEKQAEVMRQSAAMWQNQAEREKQRAEALARQAEELRASAEARYNAAETRRAEAERLRLAAERQRGEAERQRADGDRLRSESERLRAESDQRRERAETRLGTAASAAESLALALARAISDAARSTGAVTAERRAQILESAETLNDQLRGAGDTPELRHREAQLRLSLAEAYAQIGDHRRALDRAVAARTALEALQRQAPANGRFDGEILTTYLRAGDALTAQGDHAKALQAYREAVPLSEKFAAQDVNDGARQFEGAALRMRMAGSLKVIGDVAGARREIELASDVLKRLVARPDGQRWQAALAEAEGVLRSLGSQ
jgi:hypothetical protein